MNEKPLSNRQKNILEYIQQYAQSHGRPPTIREIGTAVSISSTSVVNYNLTRLEEMGMLERDADVSRGLRLTEKAAQAYGAVRTAVAETIASIVRVPLLGNIVASQPIPTVNDGFSVYDEDDAIQISTTMLPGKTDDLFALRVSGDSMIDAMVNDGDIVIMRQDNTARNGDMVAALVGGDTITLKRFYNEGERIRLQPANPTMGPIYVDPGEVQVQGKVMMVLRQTA